MRAGVTRSTSATRALTTAAGAACEVVVVGAGVMGLNVAYQLKRRAPDMRVTVLERAAGLGVGSTGYSTGFMRAFYSRDDTMALALDGIRAYRSWADYLRATDGVDATFTETGALWMLGADRPANEAMAARLARFGVASDVLDEAEVSRRFPALCTSPFPTYDDEGEEVAHGLGELSALHEHGCGHMDPGAVLSDLLGACRREGVDVRFNQRVEAIATSAGGERCVGVDVGGARIEAGVGVVNAAGPWFAPLMESAGARLSTRAVPVRVQVAHLRIPSSMPEIASLPFVADAWGPSGIYFMPRAANGQLVLGSIDAKFESEEVNDADTLDDSLDSDVKMAFLHCLFHRLPALANARDAVGFSAMYTVNRDDNHPIIGETSVARLWACNGFSGHGFKLAPAVGSLVARQMSGLTTDAWETSVPLDAMSAHREPLASGAAGAVLA